MIRNGSFSFLSKLDGLQSGSELQMTSPVTVSLKGLVEPRPESLDGNSEFALRLALDWWVHVGGSIRQQLEARFENDIQAVSAVEVELLMRADPVVAFEVGVWLDRRLRALTARSSGAPIEVRFVLPSSEQAHWSRSVPLIETFGSIFPSRDSIDPERSADLLGISGVFPSSFYREFVQSMRDEIGADLFEPPWMFWSRLPVWIKRRNRKADVSELELRLSFLRASLSPQDEVSEAASLDPGSVMINPTFEAVERSRSAVGSSEAPLLVRARFGENVTSRTIAPLEAQILDHVRDSFRSVREVLIRTVEGETGIHREFIERAVSGLSRDGFLLEREATLL